MWMLESESEEKSQKMWFIVTNEEFSEYLDLEVTVSLFFLSSCQSNTVAFIWVESFKGKDIF